MIARWFQIAEAAVSGPAASTFIGGSEPVWPTSRTVECLENRKGLTFQSLNEESMPAAGDSSGASFGS